MLHWLRYFVVSTTLISASVGLQAQTDPIHVAVAANFNSTLEALIALFEEHQEHRVLVSSGSSGKLYAQIQNGAPFHLFLSADSQKPEALELSGLAAPGTRFTYALGALALWAPHGAATDVGPHLLRSGLIQRLALANPRLAPYGSAAVDVLEQLELEAATRATWVLGENIAQTYQFIASGAADAGFVAVAQLSHRQANQQGTVWRVPPTLHRPIAQQAVLLQRAANHSGAQAFWQFLQSDEARAVITRHGYTVEHRAMLKTISVSDTKLADKARKGCNPC